MVSDLTRGSIGILLVGLVTGCMSEVSTSEEVLLGWRQSIGTQFPKIQPVRAWHFVVDPSVTSEQYDEVVEAIEDWRAKVTCEFAYYIERRPTLRFVPQELPNYLPEANTIEIRFGETPEGPSQQGWAHWEKTERNDRVTYGAWVIIRPDLGSMTGRVLRHEIGHTLFLDHDSSLGAVMNPNMWSQSAFVTREDAARYDATWCTPDLSTK